MSNSTSTTTTSNNDMFGLNPLLPSISSNQHDHQHKPKKQRNQPGNPDPEAEVVALSPKTLMTTNRFVCEICNKGFQRDQNLQLHRRGHNLPWKLRQKSTKEGTKKRVYVCPEPTCVHNHPSRALGDLTGIKKHFYRKHGEKVWKCEKCSKKYAVMSDWKAHTKTCGTREYRCDCGTLFSRKDSFITHRAFCDALAEESAKLFAATTTTTTTTPSFPFSWNQLQDLNPNPNLNTVTSLKTSPPHHELLMTTTTFCDNNTTIIQPQLSATALLQKASTIGSIPTTTSSTSFAGMMSNWHAERMTRDFLGVVVPVPVPAGGGQDELLLSGLGLEFASPSPCDHNTTSSTTTARIGFTPRMWGDC